MAEIHNIDDERARRDTAESPPLEAYAEDVAPGTTDEELALRFSAQHADTLRYVAAWDRWLIWDGCRWKHDETMRTWDMARALCRDVVAELAHANNRTLAALGSAGKVYAVLKLARVDRRHAVAVADLDSHPWLLNTPGGVIDLQTGAVMPHDRSQLHTKVTAATPQGDCPVFRRTLERVIPAQDVRDYLQRLAGYALTGSSREHVFPFFWGGGRNGKGTVLRAIQSAMGDYAVEIAAETLMESAGERHQTEMTPFFGARLVIGSEIAGGKRWNESRIKLLTGGDPISARYCAKDFFTFIPTHTLIVMGNAKPGLRNVDEAMRARLHLVKFGVTISESERDLTLADKLKAEQDGILQWALEGCLTWQRTGTAPPASVRNSTEDYLNNEDHIQGWIDDCCERGGQLTLKAAFANYRKWTEGGTVPQLGKNGFSDALEAKGFVRGQESRSRNPVFAGISLKQIHDRWSEPE